MSKFMYLFRTQSEFKPASPEEMERMMKAWTTWIDGLRAQGHLVQTGERLDRAGQVVRGKAKTVTDGPYAEAKDIVGGYMLVQANDLAQAVELSKGCPIFGIDGLVEVRPVIGM
ncbi:MAG TPA: YciI family protein [Polyangiaceae bacterium]|nr:YciI family protein [Polyangiaceae bacterium]